MRRALPVLAALAAGLAGACRPAPRPDILVVTVDTARADHFSFLAPGGPPRTPAADALAAEGVAFTAAFSPTPLTLVAHSTLFTGEVPPTHGVRDNGETLGPEAVTLAELAREAGYRTGAFVAASVLAADRGLAQGFETYDEPVGAETRRGEVVAAAAEAWLAAQPVDAPVMAWLHLYDPHTAYDPPEPERSAWPGDPYSGEIAYADRVAGEFLAAAARRDRPAIVVLAGDHGEGLGDHGEATHGVFLYDAFVHVPLVIRAPGLAPGRVDAVVGLVDVMPTVAALAGLPAPASLDGRDLFAAGPPGEVYLESLYPRRHFGWSELRGLRTADRKLVRGARPELYDLAADPAESRDLAAGRPAEVAALADRLDRWRAREGERGGGAVDAATRARLEALGYLGGGEGPEQSPELPDPRERVDLLERMNDAENLAARGHLDAALALHRQVVARDPTNPTAWDLLARRLEQAGALAEAAEAFGEAARLGRGDDRARRWSLLERLGRGETVLAEARAAARADPGDREARARWLELAVRRDGAAALAGRSGVDPALDGLLAEILVARGERRAAEKLLREVRAAAPDDAASALGLARLLLEDGRLDEIPALLAAAGAAGLDAPEAEVVRAGLAAATGDLAAAREAVARLAARPANPAGLTARRNAAALSRVAEVAWKAGDFALAAAAWGEAARVVPGDPRPAANRGLALERLGRLDEARAAFAEALRRDPDFAPARRHAAALRGRGAAAGGGAPSNNAPPRASAARGGEP